MGKKVLAFETGGSTFLSGIIEEGSSKIHGLNKEKIACDNKNDYLEEIILCIKETVEQSSFSLKEINSIGVVSAGKWDFKEGIVTPPNLPFKTQPLPIAKNIHENFGRPVYMENDVNAGVLAEMLFGHGKKTDSRYIGYLTISSGIGFGLYDKQKEEIFSGETGQAPEVGHNVVEKNGLKCGCGGRGHWETYGSGNGVVNIYEELHGENISAKKIYERAEKGDERFLEVTEKAAEYNAIGVGQIINAYQPGLIVFGGTPVFKSRKMVFGKLKKLIEDPPRKNEYTYISEEKLPDLRVSELGENNILLGAGAIALKKIEGKRL